MFLWRWRLQKLLKLGYCRNLVSRRSFVRVGLLRLCRLSNPSGKYLAFLLLFPPPALHTLSRFIIPNTAHSLDTHSNICEQVAYGSRNGHMDPHNRLPRSLSLALRPGRPQELPKSHQFKTASELYAERDREVYPETWGATPAELIFFCRPWRCARSIF